MNLEHRTNQTVAILALHGRFDAHAAPPVLDWLEKSAASGTARIVVDLSQVNFLDSTGLATLVQGMKRCRSRGGDLRLCQLQQPVRIIFELTRLDRTFEIFSNEKAAIDSFDEAKQPTA